MKRFIAFLCVFTILFSSFSALASPGDIIHTGLKKIYRANTLEVSEDLINDILNGIDTSKFYREVDRDKYVNVEDEEKAHLTYIKKLQEREKLSTPQALQKYLIENQAKVESELSLATNGIIKPFDNIKLSKDDTLDNFQYSSSAPTLSQNNFTVPEPGNGIGTIMFSKLVLPPASFKWKMKVSPSQTTNIDKNLDLSSLSDYIPKRDISIKAGEYIDLYAVDRSNKALKFISIKVLENMIRKAIIYPEKLIANTHYVGPVPGEETFSTRFSDLNLQGIDGDSWNLLLSRSRIDIPEMDGTPMGIDYTLGQDIVAQAGDNILLTAVKEGKIKAYSIIKLTEDDIKAEEIPDNKDKALILTENIHFSPLLKGSEVGFTKFDWIKPVGLEGEIVWRYIVSNKIISIPKLDSSYKGTDFTANVLNADKNIQVSTEEDIKSTGLVDKNIMLIASVNDGEDYKIKGYALLKSNLSNVKMPSASIIEVSAYSTPVKGNTEYTTKIESLKNDGIAEFNQWRYKLTSADPGEIEFNSAFSNSSFYSKGVDIFVREGDTHLILAATDGYAKVKQYAVITLNSSMIRRKDAALLIATTNYGLDDPAPGSKIGSTKFDFLSFSSNIIGASKWMVAKSKNSFGNIEIDSIFEASGLATMVSSNYKAKDDIENVSIDDYILLLATDDNGKVKGFGEFQLSERDIRGGVATPLTLANYSIEKGSSPGTTRFKDLKFDGVYGASEWKYKWMKSELSELEKPYLNQIIEDTNFYSIWDNIGLDIAVSEVPGNDSTSKYGYLMLLAVDNNGKTKGYSILPVDSNVVKEHAPEIGESLKIKPGTTIDKINFDGIESGQKYIYLLGDTKYPTPAVGDMVVGGTEYKGDITVRIGQHLTIFQVDANDQIEKFKRFIIESKDIKQGSAILSLVSNPDNIISEGSIVNGGIGIQIKLTDAEWSNNIDNKTIRDELFRGLSADNNSSQWFEVITTLINDGGGMSVTTSDTSRDTLTFYLAKSPGYDISSEQKISLKVPFASIEGAINPIQASGNITIKPTIRATISGDVISRTIREKDLTSGGVEIVVKLLDGNWVGSIDKDVLIDGFVEKIEGTNENILDTNWEKVVKPQYKSNGKLTRNSSKELTLTLPQVTGLDFGNSREDISVKIPKELIQGANIDVVASPMFSIYPDVLKIEAKSDTSQDTVTMQAPDGKEILKDRDTWKIQLTNSTFIDNLTNKDIVISNLPSGLKYVVERENDKTVKIRLSGIASTSITDTLTISALVKGSAVKENNSEDSDPINLKIKVNEALSFDGISYELKDDGIYLVSPESIIDKLQYSIDSTNGINGTWKDLDSISKKLSTTLTPIRILVREKLQNKVFKEIVDLKHSETPNLIEIKSIEYVLNDESKIYEKKITLENIDSTMEYTLDGGSTWNKLPSASLTLDESSDLRIKKAMVSGSSGTLSSQATKRLNGLFLGNVDLKVSSGKIVNTNTSMEYSLDSTDGTDGSWKKASAGETVITFSNGNKVWIRETGNKINSRKLGTVNQKDVPQLDGIDYNIFDEIIVSSIQQSLEYKMGSEDWKSLDLKPIAEKESFSDKIKFTSGELSLRTAGDDNHLPSLGLTLANIPKAIDPPELKGNDNDKTIHYLDTNGIWKEIDDTFKYKFGSNGDWILGSNFKKDDVKNYLKMNSVIVYVVKIASKDKLPSIEKSISFTKNMTFENVNYNVEKKSLEGTNANMEYSVNSSILKNGKWLKITGDKVSIEPFEGMYLWVREKDKPSTENLLVIKLKRHENPTLNYMYYNIMTNKFSNQTGKNLEYKIADGEWTKIDAGESPIGINFKPGKLEFRHRATKDKMESQAVLKTTIKAPLSGPDIKYSDIKNNIISINDITSSNSITWDKFEYRIDPKEGTIWRTGELLAGEDLSGDKKVQIRIAATNTTLSSQIKEIAFKKNLDLQKVALSTHVNPHVLNGTTVEMEYQIYLDNLENGERTGWEICKDENTVLPPWIKNNMHRVIKIEVRDGREGLTEDVFEVYIK